MRTSRFSRILHFFLFLFLFPPLISASIFRKSHPVPASVTKNVPSETDEADQNARDIFPHRVLSSIIVDQLGEGIEYGKIYAFSRYYPGSFLKKLSLGDGYVDLIYACWVFDESTNGRYLYARSYGLVFKENIRAKDSEVELDDFLPEAALSAVKNKHRFIAHGQVQAQQIVDRDTMATLLDQAFVKYRREHMEKKLSPGWSRGLQEAFLVAAEVEYPKGKNEEENHDEEEGVMEDQGEDEDDE